MEEHISRWCFPLVPAERKQRGEHSFYMESTRLLHICLFFSLDICQQEEWMVLKHTDRGRICSLCGIWSDLYRTADALWKKGMVFGILITVAVIVSIGAGFVMGSSLIDTLTAWIGNLSGRVISGALFAGAAVAIVLYVISLILQLRVVSKYEVCV